MTRIRPLKAFLASENEVFQRKPFPDEANHYVSSVPRGTGREYIRVILGERDWNRAQLLKHVDPVFKFKDRDQVSSHVRCM